MRALIPLGLSASLLFAPVAHAAPVTLRALDQSNLSRISMRLGEKTYRFEKVGVRQFDLILSESGVAFDTRQIYPDRLASRVISARSIYAEEESRLRFVLNCDCPANTRNVNGSLVIEFEDSDTNEASAEESTDKALERPSTPEGDNTGKQSVFAPTSAPQPIARRLAAGRTAPITSAEPPEAPEADLNGSDQLEMAMVVPKENAVHERSPKSNPGVDAEIKIARKRLLEQLTRAAEQGLLEFSADGPNDPSTTEEATVPVEPVHPESEDERAPVQEVEVETAALPVAKAPMELPLRTRTAVDRDFTTERMESRVESELCPIGRALDSIDWPNAEAPASDIALLRSNLLGEFDKPQTDFVDRLAKLYIAQGFGAEARHLLKLYGDDVPDADLLADLARIVDGEVPDRRGRLVSSGPCTASAALWLGAAGQRGLPAVKGPSIDAELLDHFAMLPVTLRRAVGPALLSHFIAERDAEMARKVDQVLQRTAGKNGAAHDLALARFIALNGNDPAAEAIYNRIARSRSPNADDALLLLIESRLRRNEIVSEDLLDRLSYAAFVGRSGPKGTDLKLAEISARAGSGQLPAVLDELEYLLGRNPRDKAELQDLGHAMLETSDAATVGDLRYAQAVITYADQIAATASGDRARAKAASELTRIGLSNAALDLLAPALARRDTSVAIAAAGAYLSLNDHEKALNMLGGISEPDALLLRITALERSGNPAEALGLLSELAEEGAEWRASLAWQAGDWDRAQESGPPTRRLLAAYMAGAEPNLDDIDRDQMRDFLASPELSERPSLQASEGVLGRSETVRTVIEEALVDG